MWLAVLFGFGDRLCGPQQLDLPDLGRLFYTPIPILLPIPVQTPVQIPVPVPIPVPILIPIPTPIPLPLPQCSVESLFSICAPGNE